MIRLALLAGILVACGGSSDPDGGGSVSGTIDDGTGAVPFSGDCEFFSTDNYVHVAVTDDQTGVEVIWDPAIVDEPGVYTTSGIVPDITIAALVKGDIVSAQGSVTFTVIDASHVVGSLELTANRTTGTASFDCTR